MSICYNLRLKSKIKEESYIRINTRELNEVLSIKYLPYIYWANDLCYTKSSLS